jgi:hypothetical protein
MDAISFKSWLDAYGRAWIARDAESAASLYTDDATYQVTPFTERHRGRAAILDYWRGVCETEQDIQFSYEILGVTANYGIAHWWASFSRVPPGLPTKLDGIFLITLNSEGLCHSLREWWVKQQ